MMHPIVVIFAILTIWLSCIRIGNSLQIVTSKGTNPFIGKHMDKLIQKVGLMFAVAFVISALIATL